MAKNKLSKLIAVFAASLFLTACIESNGDSSVTSLDQIKQEAEEARAHASQLGFEWNTIQPLLDKASEAQQAGDDDKARTFYQEAKHQSMLAVEQAEYAEKHWQLLIPGK